MSLKKDKEKVFGGKWSKEQFNDFLAVTSHDGTDVDYLMVIQAYRYMLAPTFSEYIALFTAAGHNLNALNLEGESILTTISSHTASADYANVLKDAGATT